MGLYRVSGHVTAPDGTTYAPLFYGDWWQALRVRDAIADGAGARGEVFEVNVTRLEDGASVSNLCGRGSCSSGATALNREVGTSYPWEVRP